MPHKQASPSGSEGKYSVSSPNKRISLLFSVGAKLEWSVTYDGAPLIAPSSVSLRLGNGEILGEDAIVIDAKTYAVDAEFGAISYRKARVVDRYACLELRFEKGFGIEFRVYDDAVAYRFTTHRPGEIVILHEEANFNFGEDHHAFIPYMWDYRDGKIFNASFESPYTEQKLSEFKEGSLSLLPMLVEVGKRKKVVILEADLEDYPGMYLKQSEAKIGLEGVFAPFPLAAELGGFRGMNFIPTERAEYIAKTKGTRPFPWRALAICEEDKELLNNDIVQKLASPPRLADTSWILPGQVAWDWWSDYNVSHVDFKAGINTPTYKYYVDFAAANRARYIILDGGWSAIFDLNEVSPDLDLPDILAYAASKGIGVILWATWYAITKQMRDVFPKYAKMGIKGWKIDFIDRDDQLAVASTYEIAEFAAKYKFLVDYHGVFKPTGLQRTYPNVVGYEGVYGLENFKWADTDAPRYAVTIPFTRNMAGPMDYTSGAMINATQEDFVARMHAPMSKGTRCHQLAQYVVFEAPLQMLSDSPTLYIREQECTDFITSVPTVFDETVALDGKVGEYVAIARRKGATWYLGAMTNWNARDLSIDCSFLGEGSYSAVVFQDGVNSDREATDYKKSTISITSGEKMAVHLSKGGGWAARIERQGP